MKFRWKVPHDLAAIDCLLSFYYNLSVATYWEVILALKNCAQQDRIWRPAQDDLGQEALETETMWPLSLYPFTIRTVRLAEGSAIPRS